MQAGTSQLALASLDPALNVPTKERKPRHKSKGKSRVAEAVVPVPIAPLSVKDAPSAVPDGEIFSENGQAWQWAPLAETTVSSHPPTFTNDCRYFFSIAGKSVKVYATATGQVVSTLSSVTSKASSSRLTDGHADEITAVLIDPRNAFQLITASLDGRIKIWDFLEASLLNTVEVGEPITHMCAHKSMRNHVFVATMSRKKRTREAASSAELSKVLRVSLLPSKPTAHLPIHKPLDVLKVGKMRMTTGLAVSPSGTWLVATGGLKAYVCATTALSSGFTKLVSNEKLTCLAFHPIEEYFATGDQSGQIRLWYCLNETEMEPHKSREEQRVQTTTLHWHAHAVSSIAFTPNGAYLLSGGEEAVLVIWQLHTGKREFVPRVGAPIVSVTVAVASSQSAEEEYLLSLTDGTLIFVSAGTLRISRSVARIKHDPNPNFRFSGHAPLAVHPQTSTLILPSSHPSSLLIFAPLTSTLLAELEVSPSNRVSRRADKPIEPSRVGHVVVSNSGEWLATIDQWEGDEDFGRETYMKIWQWLSETSTWNLNSRIDRPHGVHNVNALTFSSTNGQTLLISIGDDGNIKVWQPRTDSRKDDTEVFWACRSTLGYRSQIPKDAVCSPDGSLLAVAHGQAVAVFELSNNVLRLALTLPEVKEVSRLAFVGSGGRYIVVAGHRSVVLWDLVASSIRWHYASTQIIRHVVSHPKNNTFAIMCNDHHSPSTAIYIFDVGSPIPVSSPTLPFYLRQAVWYPYIASGGDFTLVGITESWKSVVFGDHISLPEHDGLSAKGIPAEPQSQRRNIFQDIFGSSAFQDFSAQAPPPVLSDQGVATGGSKSSRLFDAPAYLLPPLCTLFTPLLEDLLRKKPIEPPLEPKEEQEQEQVEDVVMADSSTDIGVGEMLRKEEVDEFVVLFEDETFASTYGNLTTSRNVGRINGNGPPKAVNGKQHHNSASSAAHILTSVNGKNHPPNPLVETEVQASGTSAAVLGKKRKKAMD